MDTEYQEELEDVRFPNNYPGSQRIKQAKNVFFLRDGNDNRGSVKLAIHPSKYRSLDALLNELTQKMPDLSYGVRSIFTPKGHDRLQSLEDLDNESLYICSQFPNKAKGVNLIKLKKPLMPNIKKPNNNFRFNTAPLGNGETDLRIKRFKNQERRQLKAPASVPESDSEQMISNNLLVSPTQQRKLFPGMKKSDNKRILIKKNGSLDYQQVVLLNRRTMRTFEQFMDDLCGIFMMPVRRLYSLDGKQIESLSAIFNGPDIFVAAGYERFRPLAAWLDESVPADPGLNNGTQKLKTPRKATVDRGKWKVKIETMDTEAESGTSANVFLTIYGKSKTTTQLPLNNPLNFDSNNRKIIPFQSGQIDEFEIITGNIGRIVKIRLHHDNCGDSPAWLLGNVQMENVDTGIQLLFPFNRWLSQSKDNKEICKELPAIYEDSMGLTNVKYRIIVYTGDCWNAGMDGKVFICLYGDLGDSGPRQLQHCALYSTRLFQKGASDIFEIEAVDLGRLKKIVIGHSAIGPGSGWFLDKVIIQTYQMPSDNPGILGSEVVFPCNRWLDHGESDGKTTIELKPQDNFRHNQMEKEMWDYERWKFQRGNIVILYSQVTGRTVQLQADGTVDADGDDKSLNSLLEIVVGDRTDVCAFRSIANKGRIMTVESSEITGGGGRGLGTIDSDFKIRVQPDRTVVLETIRHANHHVMVNSKNTGLIESKGPVSLPGKAFFPYCKGVFRDQGIICFCSSLIQTLSVTNDNSLTATGKRNRAAHYIVHKNRDNMNGFMFESAAFPNRFIRIKSSFCDCKGSGGRDCLFKIEKCRDKGYVTLQAIDNRGIYVGISSTGEVRPVVDTGEKNVRFLPEVIKFGKPRVKVVMQSQNIDETENQSSLATDAFSLREVNTAQLSNTADEKEYYTESDWKVFIHSAQKAENCEITMYIYGDEGFSGPIILGRTDGEGFIFQAGSLDEFKINIPLIGLLFKMRIEVKAIKVGVSPFWSVEQVVMENIVTEDRYTFPFNNRIFGRGYDDNEVARETAVLNTHENIPVVKYRVWLFTGTEPGSECNSPISISLFGEYGDCGLREFYSPFLDPESSFRQGMTDEMSIECVYLGELTKCLVKVHNNVPGGGWFCCKVMVEDPLTTNNITFQANRWFDSAKDDGLTSRYLNPEGLTLASENDDPENVEEMYREDVKPSDKVNPWKMRYQAKELIDVITEQAALHVEQFHEMQLKQFQNGHRE